MPIPLELLSPARDAEVAFQAILHGADAVYIGGPSHGARAAASNSIDDIHRVVEFAHYYQARVYVTLNTIIYDHELAQVERTICDLYRIGVDALIVQDMGILRLNIPPIAIHASTQCDIRSVEKAVFLAKAGFSQLVLPREFSLGEIENMRQALPRDVMLEAFVHGALCVSYSGDCQASYCANGRSANRGECAQMCRMAYDLVDSENRVLVPGKHFLSLRDLNRINDIESLANAGISSFKIEGRLKDVSYVKEVVAAYRKAIDKVIDSYDGKFCRSSIGISETSFEPSPAKAFNRGFTSYFLSAPAPSAPGPTLQGVSMANLDTPKWVGEKAGRVTSNSGKWLEAKLCLELNNGDGLGYFDKDGRFTGFRLNRIDGNRLFPATSVNIQPGTAIYRNSDARRDALLSKETAKRLIPINMELRLLPDRRRVALKAELLLPAGYPGGEIYAECAIESPVDSAKQHQTEARQRIMSKLGDTNFVLNNLSDQIGAMDFVPASTLTSLRRRCCDLLQRQIAIRHHFDLRRPEDYNAPFPFSSLTYHDNVANRLAEEFYRDHGAKDVERAVETQKGMPTKGMRVMTTRYCLRRELGACLLTADANKLPKDLYIRNKAARYHLKFDCARCQMQLIQDK